MVNVVFLQSFFQKPFKNVIFITLNAESLCRIPAITA